MARRGDRVSGRTGAAPALLFLVLLVVLGALGLLVAALVTARTTLAWGSVAASMVAGILLVADSALRRRSMAAAASAQAGDAVGPADQEATPDSADPGVAGAGAAVPDDRDEPAALAEQDAPDATGQAEAGAGDEAEPEAREPVAELAEEDTDAADSLIVADLADEVVVVDERPRYHLTGCDWLAETGLPVLPLPVREARELGFSPCAGCTPDARLVARRRVDRRSSHADDNSTTAR